MEYVELEGSEDEQYTEELRYLDEPNESLIYSEIEEEESNYRESKLTNESDTYQTRIPPRINKNRSKNSKFEEPMDVEPLEKSSIKKSQESISNDKKLLDIEDPW